MQNVEGEIKEEKGKKESITSYRDITAYSPLMSLSRKAAPPMIPSQSSSLTSSFVYLSVRSREGTHAKR
jgi:hypothetical protein